MDENMETVQEAVEAGWSDGDAVQQEASAPPEDHPAQENPPQQPEKEEQEPADQPELFTIKNRDETRQVTRDELVAMAQKGWDYDHVREERDQLRAYRQEADPALELVKSYAQRNGMNVSDYLDFCRKQELIAAGMSERDAANKVGMEKERAELDRQRAEMQAYRERQNSMAQQAQAKAQAQQRDVEAFYRAYPNVDPKAIPQEVWTAVRGGESLVNAYTMYENRRLQAELSAERQNKENRAKSPGSLGGNSAEDEASLISRYWDEAD